MVKMSINRSGEEFFEELFRHHFVRAGLECNPLSGMTADDLCQTNPLEMAGARFVDELLKRFHGEAVA